MSETGTFSLNQAQSMLPRLREQLSKANDELDSISIKVVAASEACKACEEALVAVKTKCGDITDLAPLREARARYEASIDRLT